MSNLSTETQQISALFRKKIGKQMKKFPNVFDATMEISIVGETHRSQLTNVTNGQLENFCFFQFLKTKFLREKNFFSIDRKRRKFSFSLRCSKLKFLSVRRDFCWFDRGVVSRRKFSSTEKEKVSSRENLRKSSNFSKISLRFVDFEHRQNSSIEMTFCPWRLFDFCRTNSIYLKNKSRRSRSSKSLFQRWEVFLWNRRKDFI